jgi:hypothetical protein
MLASVRWPNLYRRCFAAAVAVSISGAGCRERERWPRSDRVRSATPSRTPECQTDELCLRVAGECPSSMPVPSAAPSGETRPVATFDADRTEQRRGRFPYDAGPDAICCYLYTHGCRGRPLFDSAAMPRVADSVPRSDWIGDAGSSCSLPEADHFLDAAAHEHASIASFSRAALALLALGAPAELVAAHHVAAIDEIRHARACYALAAGKGKTTMGPGALAVALEPCFADRAHLTREVFLSGCVAETLAAAVADEVARGARSELSSTLRAIADDEAAHAALAYRAVAWLIRDGGEPKRQLERLIEQLPPGLLCPAVAEAAEPFAAVGILGERAVRAIEARALEEIVVPCTQALLERA